MSRERSIRFPAHVLVLALLAGALSACAFGEIRLGDPLDRQYSLEQMQTKYTSYVRWSEIYKARRFVHEDEREEYTRRMRKLTETVRFTDYDSEPIELDEEKAKATVIVVYHLYSTAHPYEVRVEERQEWTRDGGNDTWRVRSTFGEIESAS